ncbi:hypothetical protein [Actibacterium sp. MT2.3-13A]|uniref:hypothetical protein n=1 Tax=Actibacterium sp. MT2.3-13A TaxID=2828332 RepID=UPI001BA84ADB|nr:hypothetical protein [Actibacterium sp. MT2.3-13A]
MQVVYHLGVHCTDEDRLLKCLLKNRGTLAQQGIVVPSPGRYRKPLREALRGLNGNPASAEMQEMLLDAVMDEDHAARLVFSQETFLAAPARALDMNLFYHEAGEKTAALARLFPQAGCEFHIGIRNPATFIPALFARSGESDFAGFVAGIDPLSLCWSEMVARIRNATPGATLTVWCNEDTPLIWTEVLRALADHDPLTELEGSDDFLASIMSPQGLARMQDYLAGHPPLNELQRRRVVAAFLDKYALEEEIEIELDLPGWTEELVEEMTEAYEEDLFEIERMEGVRFITP